MRATTCSVVLAAAIACGGSNGSNTGTGNGGPTGGGVTPPDAGPGSGPDAGPRTALLTVTVTGSGRVTSTPDGIDCPRNCSMSFAAGTVVSLAAKAQAGDQFDGFSGACSGSSCSVTLDADAAVTAAFSAVVVDECQGLLPGTLPAPVVPALNCSGLCRGGDSDDGLGNFALQANGGNAQFPALDWMVVQVRDGQVTLQKQILASDRQATDVHSQPSGFTIRSLSADGDDVLQFSADGAQIGAVGTNFGPVVGIDPSGGFSVVMRPGDTPGFSFGRYDRTAKRIAGDNNTSQGAPDIVYTGPSGDTELAHAAGMTLLHHTLAFIETGVSFARGHTFSGVRGLWVDENGTRMGDPFDVPQAGSLQFLLDGSLLERADNGQLNAVWQDGSATPSALPAWLQARALSSWLFPIRQGAGYAVGGTCAGVEVVSKNGKSCGCLPVPNVSAKSSIGRDGSLIVPAGDHYELYPLLFH